MKVFTHPFLLLLVVVGVVVGGGVWLDRRDAPIREGRVVINEAFLHRLQTEDHARTRDPAIKVLSAATFQGDILRNMLITGAVTVDLRRLDRDSVEVTFTESFNADTTTMVVAYHRHRLSLREFFSPGFWEEPFLHQDYWQPHSFSGEAPRFPMPPQSAVSP
jgi:hypothetical protein